MGILNCYVLSWICSVVNSEDPDQTASQKQSDLGLCCLHRVYMSEYLEITKQLGYFI